MVFGMMQEIEATMLSETRQFRRDIGPRQNEPLPRQLADAYVDGTLAQRAQIVNDGDKSKIYRCLEREEPIQGIAHARLRVDYRTYKKPTPDRQNQMRFDYVTVDREDPAVSHPVAEMHLAIVQQNEFVLEHRYVEPAFRDRRGLGTALLHRAEEWAKMVAEQSGQDVIIRIEAGQPVVFEWARKNHYQLDESQQALFEEIQSHPDRFVFEPAVQRSKLVKDPYVFLAGQTGRKRGDAVRLIFKKVFSGQITSRE